MTPHDSCGVTTVMQGRITSIVIHRDDDDDEVVTIHMTDGQHAGQFTVRRRFTPYIPHVGDPVTLGFIPRPD